MPKFQLQDRFVLPPISFQSKEGVTEYLNDGVGIIIDIRERKDVTMYNVMTNYGFNMMVYEKDLDFYEQLIDFKPGEQFSMPHIEVKIPLLDGNHKRSFSMSAIGTVKEKQDDGQYRVDVRNIEGVDNVEIITTQEVLEDCLPIKEEDQ